MNNTWNCFVFRVYLMWTFCMIGEVEHLYSKTILFKNINFLIKIIFSYLFSFFNTTLTLSMRYASCWFEYNGSLYFICKYSS